MFFGRPAFTFRDRRDAGRQLAKQLSRFAGRKDVVVLALPRGGVPVAFEVSQQLHAPLDVFIVRKLGAPGHEELAMGAIASGGTIVRNEDVIRHLDVSSAAFEAVVARENKELLRREFAYRCNRSAQDVSDRIVILVDDGIATGASMKAAVQAVQQKKPQMVIVAVPVAAAHTICEFNDNLALTIAVLAPEDFFNVGAWYADFSQTSDQEVSELLSLASVHLPSDGDFHGSNASPS